MNSASLTKSCNAFISSETTQKLCVACILSMFIRNSTSTYAVYGFWESGCMIYCPYLFQFFKRYTTWILFILAYPAMHNYWQQQKMEKGFEECWHNVRHQLHWSPAFKPDSNQNCQVIFWWFSDGQNILSQWFLPKLSAVKIPKESYFCHKNCIKISFSLFLSKSW